MAYKGDTLHKVVIIEASLFTRDSISCSLSTCSTEFFFQFQTRKRKEKQRQRRSTFSFVKSDNCPLLPLRWENMLCVCVCVKEYY